MTTAAFVSTAASRSGTGCWCRMGSRSGSTGSFLALLGLRAWLLYMLLLRLRPSFLHVLLRLRTELLLRCRTLL